MIGSFLRSSSQKSPADQGSSRTRVSIGTAYEGAPRASTGFGRPGVAHVTNTPIFRACSRFIRTARVRATRPRRRSVAPAGRPWG